MAAWNPFLKKDIELHVIENIQKFALRVCTKSWDANYRSLLEISGLPSFESRRIKAKLCNLYKIIHGLTFYPGAPIYTGQSTPLSKSNCAQSYAIVPLQCPTLQYQNSILFSQLYCCMELSSTRYCLNFHLFIF